MASKKPHKIGYLGCGAYTPERVVTNEDLERAVDTSDEWIQRRTGVQTRRIMSDGETVLLMATRAAERALEDAGVAPDEIGDIRVAVNTWMRFPSLASQVQRELGVRNGSASDTSAGCAGFIYGVEDAYNKIVIEKRLYGIDLKSLVIGVDGLSLVTNWQDRTTCVLLGDGAGAVVLGASERSEILATVTEADGSYGDLLYSDNVLSQQVSNHPPFQFGHEETAVRSYLRMDGRKVFPVAVRTMVRNVKEVVEKYNRMHPDDPVRLSQVDYVYPHQANIRIIQSVAEGLHLPLEKVYSEGIARYGNTSAASIPIGYVDNRDRTEDRLVVDVAFGAGLASGAILRRN